MHQTLIRIYIGWHNRSWTILNWIITHFIVSPYSNVLRRCLHVHCMQVFSKFYASTQCCQARCLHFMNHALNWSSFCGIYAFTGEFASCSSWCSRNAKNWDFQSVRIGIITYFYLTRYIITIYLEKRSSYITWNHQCSNVVSL